MSEIKRKFLANESDLACTLGRWLTDDSIPAEQKEEIATLFQLDYGGIVPFCNKYLDRTIRAIKRGHVSLEGFTEKDAECFAKLTGCEKLDAALCSELSRLIKIE
jgi:hypothetical protein